MTTLYRHKDYIELLPHWERIRDLYEGKHAIVTKQDYLWPHQFELADSPDSRALRRAREQRTKYLKLPRMIKEIWTSFFFRKLPTLNQEAQRLLEGASDNIDGKGTSIYTFIKRDLLSSLLMTGQANILVDSFGKVAGNLAEQQAMGLRPFMELLSPLAVPDWETETEDGNRIGKLRMLRHEYDLILPRMRATDKPVSQRMCAERFLDGRRYAIQRYIQDEQKNKATTPMESEGWLEDGEPTLTNLLEVPIARIVSEPWLDEVSDEAERLHNLRSNRDNILYFQGYQKIFVIGPASTEDKQAMGEYLMAFAPEGTTIEVIEPASLAGYETAIDESLNNAFKVGLMQLRALPSDSKVGQSADSASEEKDNAYARAEAAIEDMENAMNEALEYFAQFKGQRETGAAIEFNRDIAPESFDEVIQIFQAFSDEFRRVDVVTKEILKKAIRKIGLSQEALEEADAAIDKMEDQPEPRPMQIAMPQEGMTDGEQPGFEGED